MLARPDFLIPLSAAERQFRDHYYGLNSAALLEDLFFDALGNFLRQSDPSTELLRPPPGQKGWDYSFDGLQLSHKVSQRADAIAALWDATKLGIESWSFDDPIVYVLGGNTPPTSLRVRFGPGDEHEAIALSDIKRPYLADGRTILIVRWPGDGRAPLLVDAIQSSRGQLVTDVLSFSRVWRHVAASVREGGGANEVDVLVTKRPVAPLHYDEISIGTPVRCDVSVKVRGGVYLFSRALLQDLSVTSNNRAVLIPKSTVLELLNEAAIAGLFAPLPLWYWVFAQSRPPDMYSIQRAEYDARFSARGNLDRL